MYKLPRLDDSRYEVVRRGVGQMYMDVNNQHWKLLERSIDDAAGHAVFHTLQQVYTGYQNTVCVYVCLYYFEPSLYAEMLG